MAGSQTESESKMRLVPADHLSIRVTPKASRDRVVVEGETVRVYVTAPPADGQANKQVLKLLGKALKLAPSRLNILRGETGRDKVIGLDGLSAAEAIERLKSLQ